MIDTLKNAGFQVEAVWGRRSYFFSAFTFTLVCNCYDEYSTIDKTI